MSVSVVSNKRSEQKSENISNEINNKEKFVWFDLRDILKGSELYASIISSFTNIRSVGVVINEDQIEDIPCKVKKIIFVKGIPENIKLINEKCDTLILEHEVITSEWFAQNKSKFTNQIGAYINIYDKSSMQTALGLTHIIPLLIVAFADETKIPLEIVLADAQNSNTQVIMKVQDNLEAKIVFGVLECGADGVLLKIENLNQLYSAYEEVKLASERLHQDLQEMVVLRTYYAGMGDRACIDLTSHLELDEGILIGSFSNGGILACSETHPLPYMKTRPFRVNAGSLQSYVLAPDNQTWYLSDLRSGMELLAVDTKGNARRVTIGRIKIERRPIMCIEVRSQDNMIVNVFMQADWHVRVLNIEGKPANITMLKPGDKVLGYTMESGRHVGVKVNELIIER